MLDLIHHIVLRLTLVCSRLVSGRENLVTAHGSMIAPLEGVLFMLCTGCPPAQPASAARVRIRAHALVAAAGPAGHLCGVACT